MTTKQELFNKKKFFLVKIFFGEGGVPLCECYGPV